jgi:predicted permease
MKAPRLPRWLLERSVRAADRPYILAEADEEFEQIARELGVQAAVGWYWREAIGAMVPALWSGRFWIGQPRRHGVQVMHTALSQSFRTIRRQPRYVCAVIVTLMLGVTAATSVFAVAESQLFRTLPYRAPDGLVSITSYDVRGGLDDRDISGPDYFDLESEHRVFSRLAAYELAPAAMADPEGRGVRIELARATPDLFTMLGIRPLAGRLFLDSEAGPTAPRRVIVTSQMAVERLGSIASAVGATLRIDGEPFDIVGVVRRTPPLDGMDVDAWVPLPYGPSSLRRQAGVLRVVARLSRGASSQLVRADLNRIGQILESAYPDSNTGRRFQATALGEVLTANLRPAFATLTLAVSLLMLVAVVNASGLLLVRNIQRGTELRIRSALGASRADITMQLVTEGLILGTVAGGVSILAAVLLVRSTEVERGVASGLNTVSAIVMSAGVAMAIVSALLATLVAGRGRHRSGLDMRTSQPHHAMVRSILLGAQIAATTVLIVCIALLGNSLQRLLRVDPGFTSRHLMAVAVNLPDALYPTDMQAYPRWPAIQQFYDRASSQLRQIPSVTSVAVAWHHPLQRGWLTRFLPHEDRTVPVGERDMVNLRAVSAGYLGVVGGRLLMGRDILADDRVDTEPVVLINETLRARYFADVDPIGTRVIFYGRGWRVVGVVADFKSHGLGVPTRPGVFPPISQMPSETVHFLIRGRESSAQILQDVREAIWRTDPRLAPYDLVSLDEVVSAETADRRLVLWLFGGLGGFAMLLSVVGLVTAVRSRVESQRYELGVRAALGARPQRLVGHMLRGTTSVVALGVGVGLLAAFALTPLLAGWLYEISSRSSGAYWWAAAVMFGVATVACMFPAYRALRSDLTTLLRESRC